MTTRLTLLLCLLVSPVLVGASLAQETPGEEPPYSVIPCPFDRSAVSTEGEDFFCGTLPVPLDYSDPAGQTIEIAFAIFYADPARPQDVPVFYLHGGPGGSALMDMGYRTSTDGSRDFDVVLIEQRGTMMARPDLMCEEIHTASIHGASLDDEAARQLYMDAVRACRDRLTAEGVRLDDFTSRANAADVDQLRQALGYAQINLVGSSYGTLLAQHVMRDYPQTIRSVILDAVVPIDLDIQSAHPQVMQDALDRLFAACHADSYCAARYPNLQETFYTLAARFEAAPKTLRTSVLGPDGLPQVVEVSIDGDDLVGIVFNDMYNSAEIPGLPRMIADLAHDRPSGQFSEAVQHWLEESTMAWGMYFSLSCQAYGDDLSYDFSGVEDLVQQQIHNFDIRLLCDLWDVPGSEEGLPQPIRLDVPVLLISGELDPITPPAYGERVAATLPNARHVVFPGMGHGDSGSMPCGRYSQSVFLMDPTAELDLSCVEVMRLNFRSPN